MRRRGLFLLLALAALPARAEDGAAARFLEMLGGRWQGSGEVRAMPARLRMHWEPVLGGRFTRLTFENAMEASDGARWRFEAQAFYRPGANGHVDGHWFDSRGMILPLSGDVEGDTLTVRWGSPDTEQGRSRYRLDGDVLTVTDEVLGEDGAWRVFGRSRLERRPRG